ncbi:1610_t:CDS:1, partial [Acaulospora morrowiae]
GVKNDSNQITIEDTEVRSLVDVNKSRSRTLWTKQEVQKLFEAVEKHGEKWTYIAKSYFQSRQPGSLERKFRWAKSRLEKDFYYDAWTPEEDEKLKEGVAEHGVGNWAKISEFLPTKNNVQICNRWSVISKSKRGKWTRDEHELLVDLIKQNGENWEVISNILNRPTRYIYYYHHHTVINAKWTSDDKRRLYHAIEKHGENWDEIMKLFPDRTLLNVKDYFRRVPSCNPKLNSGRWNVEEKSAFEEAINKYGKKWKMVASFVGSRSSIQCSNFWNARFKKLKSS